MSDDAYDGGNLLLAVTRAGSFLLMFALNFYNRTLLSRKAANNVNVVRGLILPSYLPYVYCYCALNLAGALLATILNAKVTDTTRANSWIIPIEIAFAHWLSEGLALFLIGFGAGIRAIRRALAVSGVWGLFTAAYYFILLSYLTNRYELGKQDPDVARNRLFAMFFAYICSLLSFYLWFAFVPPEITYHRPALKFYARFYLCSYTMNLVIGICLYERVYDAVCPSSVLLYVVAAFLQPLAIFRTLQYDSQYWQGLRPNDGNPVAEAFDHLGLDTADSMAASLSNFAQDRMGLPIIHFGHLKIKNDFVAGGFSRVYFGTYKGKEVAFKIVYAMELSPSDVQEFYREATVLAQLQHECVVKCMGICVMPPALSLVLELCEYGALFDFLYKPCREVRKGSRVASESSMQSRGSIARALQEASELDVPVTGSIRNSKKSILRPSSARGSSLVSGSMRRTDDTSEGGSRNSARVRISTPHTSILRDRNSSNPEFISNPLTTINDIEAGELSGEIKNDSPSGVNIVRESFNIEGSDEVMQSKRASTKEPVGPATRLSFFNRISESKTGRSSDTHDDKDQKHSSRLSVNSDEENRPPRQSMAARFMGSMRISFARSYGVSSNYQAETILKPHIFFVNDLDRIKMMADCANAIAFLHSKGYMHCDIKSLNFLVSSNYKVKLADMGEAKRIDHPHKRDRPPIPARNWAPPEVLPKDASPESYTVKSDIYGLSMVLYELINLKLPFDDLPNQMTPDHWHSILIDDNRRPALQLDEEIFLSDRLRLLIERGWSVDPQERPSAHEIYEAVASLVAHSEGRDAESGELGNSLASNVQNSIQSSVQCSIQSSVQGSIQSSAENSI